MATNRNARVRVHNTFSGGGLKFGQRIRLIAQLRLLAVVHHRPSLLFPCHAALDDVDPKRNQAAAVLDPTLENHRRVSPAIERVHPGIWRSPRPGPSPRSIQQFILFYPFQACPTTAAAWAVVVQAKGSFIIHHDPAGPQSAQFASETPTKEQETKRSDEHYPSQPQHGSVCSKQHRSQSNQGLV